jgi:hypothetical protein
VRPRKKAKKESQERQPRKKAKKKEWGEKNSGPAMKNAIPKQQKQPRAMRGLRCIRSVPPARAFDRQ